MKGSYSSVSETPEMERVKANQRNISSVRVHTHTLTCCVFCLEHVALRDGGVKTAYITCTHRWILTGCICSLSPPSCVTAGTLSWWKAWCLQSLRRQRSSSPERTPRRSVTFVFTHTLSCRKNTKLMDKQTKTTSHPSSLLVFKLL